MKNEKRKRSNSESNNVVQNFKTVMSKIWSAVKWFQNEESEPGNLNLAADRLNQSASDSHTQPPQAKRKRLNSSENGINLYATSGLQYEAGESDEPCCSYNITQRSRSLRKDSNFISHQSSDEANDTLYDRKSPAFKREHFMSNRTATPVKQTSLYQTTSDSEVATSEMKGRPVRTFAPEPKRKHFRASLLGSPFYVGSTMYGGAASACYLNSPNVQSSKQVTVNNNASSDSTYLASVAVKQLSEVLEASNSFARDANYLPSQSAIRDRMLMDSLPELRVTSPARFLNLKRMRGSMQSSVAARQIMASASSSVDMISSSNTSSNNRKFTTKMKPAVTKKRASKNLEDEMPQQVNLPNAVLEIDKNKLSLLSFVNNSSFTKTRKPSVAVQKQDQFVLTSPEKCNSFDASNPLGGTCNFSFSEPLVEQEDKLPKFLNTDPVVKSTITPSKARSNAACPKPIENGFDLNEEKWKCDACWIYNASNASSCVCCGASKPVVKLAAPSKSEPAAAVTWRCDDCWVTNKANLQKCVACGGNKPTPKISEPTKKTTTESPKTNAQPALKNPFKPIPIKANNGDWTCDICLIKNASDITACAACGGKPPSGVTASKLKTTDTGLSKLVNTQGSNWECPCCLVKNDIDRQTCICCETAKQGATKAPQKNSFNFGTASGTTFKFGITNSTDKLNAVETKPAEDKPVESEKNNNVLPKAPATGIMFGTPKAKDVTDAKADAPPKFNFGFNASKAVVKDNASKKEVEQEVPKMPVAAVSETKNATPQFSFKSMTSASTPPTFTATLKPTPSLLSVPDKKAEPVVSTSQAPQTVPSILGEDKFKNTNMFGVVPATTAAVNTVPAPSAIQPAVITTAPVLQAPKTTAAPMFSFSSVPAKAAQPPATTGPIFSFGSNGSAQPTAAPKFNFSFGGSTAAATPNQPQNHATPLFSAPTANTSMFSLGNATTNTNPLTAPNPSCIANPNPMAAPSPMASSGNMFSAKPAASAGWPPANSNIRSTFSVPSQPSFSMNATPANGSVTPMFGAPAPAAAPAAAPAPAFSFGGQEKPAAAPAFNFQAPSAFGGSHVPMFGAAAAPAPAPAPAAAPAPYNFGGAPAAPQAAGGFNFGSNPVYTFGTPCAPAGSVQFNMGSGPPATPPNIAGRKFRKAARRSTALR